ncbi:M56 family metallopeptidase [Bradyrhizobium sp. Tv2a-2]|uniref:M56 family metallopeptidase n=1 Tax=Bradyrhizobium sp. Tv2a-2 TaxID=113395 RepID=UPI000405FD29|nr:M56 family metallopeptidase [Bradyrhizobium sp. Tv2a-2]
MLSWMLYSFVVSLLMGLAALALERSARIRQRPARWLWATCMVASLAIVFIPFKASVQIPEATRADRATSSEVLPPPPTTASEPSLFALPVIGTDQIPLSDGVSTLLDWAWPMASIALSLVILAGVAHLSWSRRRWERGHMAGTAVYISEDCGPAVVGFLRPRIVVPRWLTKLPPDEQELVIAHEQSHLGAYDTQLLTIAFCLLAFVPWNPLLWWQLRRLRLAIEIDCDVRVLSLGYPVARYSETLITVGERRSASYSMTMASYGSKSFLEHRIQNMLRKKTKHAQTWALALASLGAGFAVCAAEVAPPKVDFIGKSSSQEISVEPQLLRANGQSDVRALRSQIIQMQAEGIADKLAQFIKEIQNQVGWITQLPTTAGSIDQRRFDALRLLRQAPPITELSLLDSHGKEYLKVSRLALDVVGSGTDYSKEAKFTETVARKIYYGPVYMRRESEPYMTLALAGGRSDAGVSVVELNLKSMWEIVQHTRVGDRGVAYVVNAEGRIIAHPDFGVGKSLRDLSSLDQVREARTTASMGSARIARDMNNQEVVAAYARVTSTGWLVFVELPIEEWTKF